ncbi:hypothetical protein BN7_1771 [Wickerhamomyces ciferrii]|uniref:AB hydrolase-1 domain-containing protein n=1 Tax=Wickerhamomyces ciferrii (strain ATCC 14091 / BCRC 22168 / CBS 111 / JCM 3599 / NBRC 0793 / NRRL Y-1031 F-60-10) TaxID=1206466 RepID=K0KJC2_WICCF|nr:uncharacterized protein BN7_1771 [Wickerhamomyces ciferrii]CCH42227.1 hypothetical protein BN7_1771 [Wickerhamomyces ciferrii]
MSTATASATNVSNIQEKADINYTYKDSFRHWLKKSNLSKSESDVLSLLPFYPESDGKRIAKIENVDIGNNQHIHEFNIRNIQDESLKDDHVVLVHGYGAALGFFYKNFDSLTEKHGMNLHALDLLGYGLSSRPKLPKFNEISLKDVETVENFFINSIESWRKAKKIDKFKLIGHSFGGYLSAVYALKYPEHVSKLILISPVGVERSIYDLSKTPLPIDQQSNIDSTSLVEGPEIEQEIGLHNEPTDEPIPSSSFLNVDSKGYVNRLPNMSKTFKYLWDKHISPFTILRVLGPWGPQMSASWSFRRFGQMGDASEIMKLHIYSYNTFVAKGSGEHALTRILAPGALARYPLLSRLPGNLQMDSLFMYGDKDWMSKEAGLTISKEINELGPSNSKYQVIKDAGHHIYLDNPVDFKQSVYKFFDWI